MKREIPPINISCLIDTSNRRQCRACGLYLNQLPVLDRKSKASVFWIGLSSVFIGNEEEKLPLSPFTRSGALLKEIEEPFVNMISFYKTNVVKCLPLINNKIRYPFKHEMEKCFPNLEEELNILKPSLVFLLGKQVASFVTEKLCLGEVSLDENFNYDSYIVNNIRYVPIHHPSYVLVYKRKNMTDYIDGVNCFFRDIIKNVNRELEIQLEYTN
jgi:uracil-DNA glycosylase